MMQQANRVPSVVENYTQECNRELAKRINELENENSKLKDELTRYLRQINHYQDLALTALDEQKSNRKDISVDFLRVAG